MKLFDINDPKLKQAEEKGIQRFDVQEARMRIVRLEQDKIWLVKNLKYLYTRKGAFINFINILFGRNKNNAISKLQIVK